MDKINNLLQQVSIIQNKYNEIAKITGENFNIFSVMRSESDEVRTHSRIIAEFLNPKGMHNQGSVFLKLFFEEVEALTDIKPNFDYENAQILLEEHAGRIYEDYSEGGFIDIIIKDSINQVVIENKIFAGDQKGQLLRYKNKYPNCKLIYLTLNGKSPSELSYKIKNGQELKLEDIILLSYKNVIKNWIEKCLQKTVTLPIIRETLIQYLHLIKKLTNQTTNNKMEKEILELISKDDNSFKSAKIISENYEKAKFFLIQQEIQQMSSVFKEFGINDSLMSIDRSARIDGVFITLKSFTVQDDIYDLGINIELNNKLFFFCVVKKDEFRKSENRLDKFNIIKEYLHSRIKNLTIVNDWTIGKANDFTISINAEDYFLNSSNNKDIYKDLALRIIDLKKSLEK